MAALPKQYLQINIGSHAFGVPAHEIQDVLSDVKVTHVPLAPSQVSGIFNLRGRIVTVIDLTYILNLDEEVSKPHAVGVVIEKDGAPYCLQAESVDDVQDLDAKKFDLDLSVVDVNWQPYAMGVLRDDDRLIVILNPDAVINGAEEERVQEAS